MKAKYEVYTCNKGNPTVIFNDKMSLEDCQRLATVTYQNMPVIDQGGIILNVDGNNCVFRLIGGEFCGNACATAVAYMNRNYNSTKGVIKYEVENENGERQYINVNYSTDGKTCTLQIPREALLSDVGLTESGDYLVNMDGMSHIVVPKVGKENNRELAIKIRDYAIEHDDLPEVFGIIFLDEYEIDPYIWIPTPNLLQNQQSCLSGSVAAAKYLMDNYNEMIVNIKQPTGLAYTIEIQENYILLSGTIDLMVRGTVEIDEENNSKISKVEN